MNTVEREGLSLRHPARFVLVGSGNPEEGELRPQLLDRFGLAVTVTTPTDLATRVAIVRRRDAYERDPAAFAAEWAAEEARLGQAILAARAGLPDVTVPDAVLEAAARLCLALGTDGLRGELTLMRTARAQASLDGAETVTLDHLRAVAPSCLSHRLRRNPLDEAGSEAGSPGRSPRFSGERRAGRGLDPGLPGGVPRRARSGGHGRRAARPARPGARGLARPPAPPPPRGTP